MTQTREIFQTAAKDFLQSLDGILSKADMKTLAFSLSANTGTIDIECVKKRRRTNENSSLRIESEFQTRSQNCQAITYLHSA